MSKTGSAQNSELTTQNAKGLRFERHDHLLVAAAFKFEFSVGNVTRAVRDGLNGRPEPFCKYLILARDEQEREIPIGIGKAIENLRVCAAANDANVIKLRQRSAIRRNDTPVHLNRRNRK